MDRPTVKRKEREKEARREAILDAAARVFSRKGFYEATLDEVAAEAELAKGTIYNYYQDKQALFVSLMERGFHQFIHVQEAVVRQGGTLGQLLQREIESILKTMRDNIYMFRMVLTAGAHFSEKLRLQMMQQWHEQVETASERLAETLATLPETAHLSADERRTGASLVMAAIHSLHHRQLLAKEAGEEPFVEDVDIYVRLLCRALTVEKTA
jgi:AcrR family transcriptional regulator